MKTNEVLISVSAIILDYLETQTPDFLKITLRTKEQFILKDKILRKKVGDLNYYPSKMKIGNGRICFTPKNGFP